MSNKNFIPPIIEQWIDNLEAGNYNNFQKDTFAIYLENTRNAINAALVKFNSKKIITESKGKRK